MIKTIVFATLASLCLIGCNPTDSKELTNDAGKFAETAVRSLSNASVAVKVNTALSLRKGVHMEGLHVESEGGTVTIGGHVGSQKEKNLVLTIAKETRGVEKLIDNLRIE